MVLVTKPMFWDMGNHLGPFSEASDRPGGQELGGGAVGGQEILQDVKFNWGNNSAFVRRPGWRAVGDQEGL